MGEKSDELGGRRTITRHTFEGGAVTALSALIVGKLGGLVGVVEPWEQAAALSILVGILGGFAKFWHENRITARALARVLGPDSPAGPTAGALIAAFLISGCAIQLGTADPKEFRGAFGETIVACEIKGISIAVGDADICRNVEGGRVSQTFADMTLGVVRIVGQAVAGFFSGLGGAGAGMRDALEASPSSPPASSPPTLTAPVESSASVPIDDDRVTTAPLRAPFQ